MSTPVHDEWDHELVPAGNGINFRAFAGTVNWTSAAGGEVLAYVVFRQYGGTHDWVEAKRLREIDFKNPAHIEDEHLDAVLSALRRLCERQRSRGASSK